MISKWSYPEGFNEIDPTVFYGFIYRIVNKANGKFYIGKKIFQNSLKKKITQKELAEHSGKGRKPTHTRITKESNWQSYWGSNKDLLADVKEYGEENFEREILKLCITKKQHTYYELYYQCIYNVLETDSYNDNILAKFYRRDFVD
jgi:hypothetical protein